MASKNADDEDLGGLDRAHQERMPRSISDVWLGCRKGEHMCHAFADPALQRSLPPGLSTERDGPPELFPISVRLSLTSRNLELNGISGGILYVPRRSQVTAQGVMN